MTEERHEEQGPEAAEADAPQQQEESGRRGFSDGLRQGLGVLSAFKEALEETIHDARERGDLSADRAKELLHGAVTKAKEAAGEARERLDFATQQELDGLRAQVEELRSRLDELRSEGGASEEDDGPEQEA